MIELLRYVASFLTSERSRKWLPGIVGVLEVVEDDSLGDLEALKKADSHYRTMFGPAASGISSSGETTLMSGPRPIVSSTRRMTNYGGC